MPVYNGEKYLKEAIDSILNQIFTEFEFIIINDGSTDNTEQIILSYSDERIRYVKNEANLKIVKSLNKGLWLAKGEYIARMDADDVAPTNRLAVQYDFMRNNSAVSVCGSYMQVYEESCNVWRVPLTSNEIKAHMLFECCLYHPTVIFKKDLVIKNEGYRESFSGAEDYELWQRLSQVTGVCFANIPEPLLKYRVHPLVDRGVYKEKQRRLAGDIRFRQLTKLGLVPTEEDFFLINLLSSGFGLYLCKLPILNKCELMLSRIEAANAKLFLYGEDELKNELRSRWLKLCLRMAYKTPLVAFKYFFSNYSGGTFKDVYYVVQMVWRAYKKRDNTLT